MLYNKIKELGKPVCGKPRKKTSQKIGRWCLPGGANSGNKGPEREIPFDGLKSKVAGMA